MDLLADLNDSQRQAVQHVDGPLLVLAGAGSGKTLTITRRIGYLVSQGVAPWNILAVTFTNKAAGEMAQRVDALGVGRGATVATFPSFCVRLLHEFADAAGLPGRFTIYDSDDQLKCVAATIKQMEIPLANFTPRAVLSAISRAKNKLQDPAKYAQTAGRYFEKIVARVYAGYQNVLTDNNALDFDDLLLKTAYLLRDHPEIREALGQRYQYVLIDEYQDTNHAQYVIAHGIALGHENICATGDPDQSIYGWRGADLNNILDFEKDYPDAVVVRLEKNYRSVQPILSAASSLISCNRRRKHKQLLAVRPGGQKVEVIRTQDEHAEAREAAAITVRLRGEGLAYRDMAVFYRVNALGRVLEEQFRSAGVSYQIARGVEFYNRREIKDVLAYLKLMVNPADSLSCGRIINVPARGIGKTTAGRLEDLAAAKNVSLLEACRHPDAPDALGKASSGKVAAFGQLVADLTAKIDVPLEELLEEVIVRSGIEKALSKGEEDRQAQRNVQELVSAAAEFHDGNPEATLADYLQQVALVSDLDAVDPEVGAVTFMTLHAAKGLEFPVVIMVGCEEGLLPFQRGDDGDRDLEEERRLAFVGITRARDRLFMTSAKTRMIRGATCRQVESTFLNEIGRENVARTDKTLPDPPPSRGSYHSESFGRSFGPSRGFNEDANERAIIEAMEAAETIPEEFAGIRPGQRVRHAKFGPGKILSVSGDGTRTRALVEFDRFGRKTLILEQARLEPI